MDFTWLLDQSSLLGLAWFCRFICFCVFLTTPPKNDSRVNYKYSDFGMNLIWRRAEDTPGIFELGITLQSVCLITSESQSKDIKISSLNVNFHFFKKEMFSKQTHCSTDQLNLRFVYAPDILIQRCMFEIWIFMAGTWNPGVVAWFCLLVLQQNHWHFRKEHQKWHLWSIL